MCGIAGIFSYGSHAPAVDRDELLIIREWMIARGPDDCGVWYSLDNQVGLVHRRLSIIDLSEYGAQPMSSADGTLIIIFNGEIYNYRELRSELETKGYRFYSSSDTEVLLNLYAYKGAEMLHDIRGMYAFSIWDNRDNSLFLARDPFGIKPLYYADNGQTFRFASQVKALLAGGQIDTSPEPAGHVGFFLWGHVPEPYTMYKGIRALPAGSYLHFSVHHSAIRPQSFCSIPQVLAQASRHPLILNASEQNEYIREALLDSVRHHLISDVPVGLFLSAGLDSTTLTALAAELVPDCLHTVTLGFNEFVNTVHDEVPLAELVARHYGTEHNTINVEKHHFQDNYASLKNAMDQPTTDGINSYFICKAANQAGLKVAISGLGGDELFGSYPSFQQIPKLVNCTVPLTGIPGLGRGFRLLATPLLKQFTSPKYAGLLEYGGSYGGAYLLRRGMFMPWELPEILDSDMVREGWRELQTLVRLEKTENGIVGSHLKISALEMVWYMKNQLLRDTDWASMAHSLEVRVPFVDIKLLQTLAPLFTGNESPTKQDMARTPTKSLPDAIVNKGKTGFTIPVREWLMDCGNENEERGLRGWAKKVYAETTGDSMASYLHTGYGITKGSTPSLTNQLSTFNHKPSSPLTFHSSQHKRILVLLTDAFGGHGGIALYNRDLLMALCADPDCVEVVAIPRLMPNPSEPLPAKLTYITSGINSKIGFVKTVVHTVNQNPHFDLIVCGHINLIPVAMMLRTWLKVPILLEIYGIDAWQPTDSLFTNKLVSKVDAFVSISEITRQRFLGWSKLPPEKVHLLPNAIHLDKYGLGPKNSELLKRYGLEEKTILMTLGRLVAHERYKGFDEVLDQLPELIGLFPDIAYLIVGKGDDRIRLEDKARTLGVADRVVFTGFIPEHEKADHYRLADAYVMPSQGEGFGFVFLEALACGIPCVGSILDGSREALRDGMLGLIVNPTNPTEIKAAILNVLNQTRGAVPEGLGYFSFYNFTKRTHEITEQIYADRNTH